MDTAQKSLQATYTDMLMQDLVASKTVRVFAAAAVPMAAYTNPHSGCHEVLVIAEKERGGRELLRLSADPVGEHGWRSETVLEHDGLTEVKVIRWGERGQHRTCLVYAESTGSQYSDLTLAGWGSFNPVDRLGRTAGAMKGSHAGSGVFVYGYVPANNGIRYWYRESMSTPFDDGKSGFVDLPKGAILVHVGPRTHPPERGRWVAASVDNKALRLTWGTPTRGTLENIPGIGSIGDLERIVDGHVFDDNPDQVSFLLSRSGGRLSTFTYDAEKRTRAEVHIATLPLRQTAVHFSSHGCHIYGTDDNNRLWAFHQGQDTNSAAKRDGQDMPQWTTPLPIAGDVRRVITSTDPHDAVTVFTASAKDGLLTMETQDCNSRSWRVTPVELSHPQLSEVARHHVTVKITDQDGTPQPGMPVTVTPAQGGSESRIFWKGSPVDISHTGTKQPLVTDTAGILHFTVPAGSLAAPALRLYADGLAEPLDIHPGRSVFQYLSGRGALRRADPRGHLTRFRDDGTTLQQAKLPDDSSLTTFEDPDGKVLSTVSQNLKACAKLITPEPVADSAAWDSAQSAPEDHAVGYVFRLPMPWEDAPTAEATILRTPEDMREHWNDPDGEWSLTEDSWSLFGDISHAVGDVMRAVESGLAAVADVVVNVAESSVKVAIRFAEQVAESIREEMREVQDLVVRGAEFVGRVATSTFNSIKSSIEKAIDWLKALFDFPAIKRTQQSLEKMFDSFKPGIESASKQLNRYIGQGADELKKKIRETFDGFEDQFRDKSAGAPARDPHPQAGWMWNKAQSDPDLANTQVVKPDRSGESLESFGKAGQEFKAAMDKYIDAIKGVTSGGIHEKPFVNLLQGTEKLAEAGVDLAAGMAQKVVELLASVAKWIVDAMNEEVLFGFLKRLIKWATGQDVSLTGKTLYSWMIAVPFTVTHRIATGKEPFPAGKEFTNPFGGVSRAPDPLSDVFTGPVDGTGTTAAGLANAKRYEIMAGCLQTIRPGPAGFIDFSGPSKANRFAMAADAILGGCVGVLDGAAASERKQMPGPGGTVSICVGAITLANVVPPEKGPRNFFSGTLIPFASTCGGLAGLIMAIKAAKEGALKDERLAEEVLRCLPGITAFLNLQAIEDNLEVFEVTCWVKAAFDLIGYAGGGGLQIGNSLYDRK